MPWMRRADRDLEENFRSTRGQTPDRPAVLDRPGRYYATAASRIPEKIRISFSDGTTAVYHLSIELPAPVFPDRKHDVIGYRWKGAKS